jgi:hypothetical protein
MVKERRKFERFPVKIPSIVEYLDVKSFVMGISTDELAVRTILDKEAFVKDISAGGLAIRTKTDLELESTVKITFLIEGHNVKCNGSIKVKLEKREGYIYGIEFSKNKLEASMKLVDYRQKIKTITLST